MPEIQSMWTDAQTTLLDTAKFVKKGTRVIVDASFMPTQRKVEGRYGIRTMFVIRTTDYGLIYVSDVQFLHVCNVLRDAKWRNVTVEL